MARCTTRSAAPEPGNETRRDVTEAVHFGVASNDLRVNARARPRMRCLDGS